MEEKLFKFRIKLKGIRPLIWRTFVVPSTITLAVLHEVIQIVMGWENAHLHSFSIDGEQYTDPTQYPEGGLSTKEYILGNLVSDKGDTIFYEYDFGDCWEHNLVLEDSDYQGKNIEQEILCLGGKGDCPPEDIGGIWGYYEYVQALDEKEDDEDDDEDDDWIENYESYPFSVSSVNSELKYYLKNGLISYGF